MAKQQVISERLLTQGTHESPEISLGRLERYTRPTLARLFWPSGNVLRLTQFYSFDGGLSWLEWGSATFGGGTIVGKDGKVLAVSDLLTSPFPEADNRNRRVKYRLDVLTPLNTRMDLESSESKILTAERM